MWHCNCDPNDIEPNDELHALDHSGATDYDRPVVLNRDGSVTGRFKGGGYVPDVVRALVLEQEESPLCPDCESLCSWSDDDPRTDSADLEAQASELWQSARENGKLAAFTNDRLSD